MKPPLRHLALVSPAPAADSEVELHERTDDELMLLARGGIEGAFDQLIRRHQSFALGVAFRYVGDAALAADLVQNTFVELYRGLPNYRAHGKFRSFLYRVLLNQCRIARRSARIELKALDAMGALPPLVPAEILLREQRREVEVALGTLSKKLREVVLLRFGADLTYEEVAEALAIPLGTVKRRLFVAMAKLRKELDRP